MDTKYDTGPVYNKILLCMDQNKILYYEDGKLGVYVQLYIDCTLNLPLLQ